MMSERPLRVLYFGTYRGEYSRNQIMMEGLRRAGVEVVECHETLWHGIEDRVQAASGGWLKPVFIARLARAYLRLVRSYFQSGEFDVLMVGYPGQMDVFLARLLSWISRRPLVWDIFMSIYLIAVERGLDRRSRLSVALLRRLEWLACRLPDRLILDTEAYVDWFGRAHGVARQRFRLVPTGADDRIFKPADPPPSEDLEPFLAVYYGTFIPNHGVPTIIEAARLLAGRSPARFELIGDGPERSQAEQRSLEYGLDNVTFIGWMEPVKLVQRAGRASLCLGAFGTTPQSLMTVQNKIYEGLAMARPVLSGDSPAVRQALQPGEQVYLCRRADPQALAEAVESLRLDPALRRKLAEGGRRRFSSQYDLAHNGQCCRQHLEELLR